MVNCKSASAAFSGYREYKKNEKSEKSEKNDKNENGGFAVSKKDEMREMREYNIVHGNSIQMGKHSYLMCIPELPPGTTKVQVARAVESRILFPHSQCCSGGAGAYECEYKYVKNVVFVEGFDEESKNAIENSCYKIAIVNIEMPPSVDDGIIYTEYENEFYDGICRGDIVIGEWRNAFLMANPNYYFNSSSSFSSLSVAAHADADAVRKENAFQKMKISIYKRKISSLDDEICDLQNAVNELSESLRFLVRQRSSEGLHGLKDSSKYLSSFLSILHNRYARVCVSDVEFLEINKNMKLKMMVDLVVNSCDDCDACQELIHSLDYISDNERRRDLFHQIEKLICRVNNSVRKFQSLHLYAERCIFGLKNRAMFADFASLLNTAVEIVEEVTSRNCTNTQDVDYVKCYGIRAMSKEQQEQQEQQQQEQPWWKSPPFDSADGSCVEDYYSSGGCEYCDFAGADNTTTTTGTGAGAECYNNYFDYYENADSVVGDDDAEENASAAAVSQMLADFESNINNSNSVSASAAVGAYANDEVVVEVEMGAAMMEEEAVTVTVTVSATAAEAAEKGEGEKEGEKNIKAAVDEKPKSSSSNKWYSFIW